MLKNFFKVAFRNILRHRLFSLVNILGLAIGLACSILIGLFVIDELSYDRFHTNAEQTYRITIRGKVQGNEVNGVSTGAPAGETMRNEIPEVTSFTRIIDGDDARFKIRNDVFLEDNFYYVDSSFFQIFSFQLIEGDKNNILNEPNTLVIAKTAAKKYFGERNPMGQSIEINDQPYKITGIVEDCPHNSHFHFEFLGSIISLDVAESDTWLSNDFSFTYLLLDKNSDLPLVEEKLKETGHRYAAPELEEFMNTTYEEFEKQGNYFYYELQPLTSIHLHSNTDFELEPNSQMSYIYIFSIISLFILLVACINFMNLSTARSATRAKEVGIRKVVGGHRRSLFWQFLFESILLSFIALLIALIIIETVMPVYNNITGKTLQIGYFDNWYIIPGLLLLAAIVGIFAGTYAAGYLSSIKIISVLKSKILSGKKNSWFRNGLVIFQFSISIFLFISTLFVFQQLRFIQSKDLGYNKEHVLVVERGTNLGSHYESFKHDLKQYPEIVEIGRARSLPGTDFNGFPCSSVGENPDQFVFRMTSGGYDLDEVMGLEMVKGRFFDETHPGDSLSIIVNEAAVKAMNYKDPIGKQLQTSMGGITSWSIIGVVKDFNFRSLHQEIKPLVFIHPSHGYNNYIAIRYRAGQEHRVVRNVKTKWTELVPNQPFMYYHMDVHHKDMHKQDFRTGKIFGIFSVLAIFIACLGLYGLAAFITEQRTKELGIRKALGAKISQLVGLLIKQFSIWVLLANLIAWPFAYLFIKNWLTNFAYQIDITVWNFIFGACIALFIAILTVSYQSFSSARKNPVDTLRYE